MIPFNKPYLTGNEISYITDVIASKRISSQGNFTVKCERFFEKKFGFKRALLTTSCTSALELAALLIDIKPGDEIIVPSYTYVSTANVFEKFGAKVVFVDSNKDFPTMDSDLLESLITKKTKAIVPMHYAGWSCDMDRIMEIAQHHNLFVIEDAAMSIGASYKNRYQGSIGHFSAFSFHETKNISCGEGGMLIINDEKYVARAEILRDKGTNRKQFLKGNSDTYEWVDLGGSYAPNEVTAAYLFAQLEQFEFIQKRRLESWNTYLSAFKNLNTTLLCLPIFPETSAPNGHTFFVYCTSKEIRSSFIEFMAEHGIQLTFHYQSLHQSRYYLERNEEMTLPHAERFTEQLVRFPLFVELTQEEVFFICNKAKDFHLLNSAKN